MNKLYKINKKDKESLDSVVQCRALYGDDSGKHILPQAETIWNTFRQFRERRARVIRFVYEDQWGDTININGKVMTQREYLSKMGNVALQANLMAPKANSIIGAHIKEGAVPTLRSIRREDQALGEILSETLRANWEFNDMTEIENISEFEMLFGGMCVGKESHETKAGVTDVYSRAVNVNMLAFDASMQDPRLNDISAIVELHDYTFNDLCAAFVHSPEEYRKMREWYYDQSSPLHYLDEMDATTKLDHDRVNFYSPTDLKKCRVIEMWTKERRPRIHVFDPQKADLYDINADDAEMIRQIEAINKERGEEGRRLGYTEDEIPYIEYEGDEHYYMDEFWYYRYMTPKGFILLEGESKLPGRSHPYTIAATPMVNGKICGFLYPAVDLQMSINRELVVYDWMKRLGAKGITFVPQSIIPDGMDYKDFAEQWTSMDGIVFYKPNNNGDRPFVEHGSTGNLNTAEMVKMLSDTMSEAVSVSGAIQGKTPYAGTSAQLYAQQKENSTTPIAVIMSKLEFFIKHTALKKAAFIQKFYNVTQYEDIASGMIDIDTAMVDYSKITDLRYKFKFSVGSDFETLRQQSNELLMGMYQQGAMQIADVLELGDFKNADAIIARLNERAQEMMAQQQAVAQQSGQSQQQLQRIPWQSQQAQPAA